jgi:hypothetical protein
VISSLFVVDQQLLDDPEQHLACFFSSVVVGVDARSCAIDVSRGLMTGGMIGPPSTPPSPVTTNRSLAKERRNDRYGAEKYTTTWTWLLIVEWAGS